MSVAATLVVMVESVLIDLQSLYVIVSMALLGLLVIVSITYMIPV